MDLQLSPAVDESEPLSRPRGATEAGRRVIEPLIPARSRRRTWSGFHTRVVLVLGMT